MSQPKDGVGDIPTLVSSAPKDDCCFFSAKSREGQRDGLVAEVHAARAMRPGFDSQDPHKGGRRIAAPKSGE